MPMKTEQKKAVESAVNTYFDKAGIYKEFGKQGTREVIQEIPYRAVVLAQVESGDTFDEKTGESALTYAKKLIYQKVRQASPPAGGMRLSTMGKRR